MIRPRLLLREFLESVYRARRSVSDDTADQYRYAITSLDRFAGRQLFVDELQEDLVSRWIVSRLRSVSARTVKRERSDILTLWRFAQRWGHCDEPPPDLERVKLPKRLPRAWNPDEVAQLVESARRERGWIRGTSIRKADWWRSLLLFLYDSGARITAALEIRIVDVDLSERIATLDADDAKTGLEQLAAFRPETAEGISVVVGGRRSGAVWPWPYRKRQIWLAFKRIILRAGLPEEPYQKFHRLRRTHATQVAVSAGIETASRSLGHASLAMTYRYVDPRHLVRDNISQLLPRVAGSGAETRNGDLHGKLLKAFDRLNEVDQRLAVRLVESL